MSLGEKLERRMQRHPAANPYVGEMPGYAQPDAVDPSGYTLQDRPDHVGDGEVSDVSPPALSAMLGRVVGSPYGDDTVRPMPGGALGEAGACSVPSLLGLSVEGAGFTGQHAVRPAPLEYQAGAEPLRSPDLDGGRDESAAASGQQRRAPLSDSDVYADVYGVSVRPRRMGEDPRI